MTRFALLAIVPTLSLAACNVSKGDGGDNVSIKADDSGRVSMNLPFAKADVKLPEGALAKGQFDIDGVKMIPGATMHGFNMDAGNKGATINVGFNAPKSPDEVRAYFLDEFKQKGDEASQAGNTVSGKTKDGDTFVINVEPAAQGSTGTIAIQSKK
jgi:hypothetical protein